MASNMDFGDIDLLTELNTPCLEQNQMPELGLVCHSLQLNLATKLIEQGADVNVCDKHGRTPLHFVCLTGQFQPLNIKIATLLVKHGAKLDAQDADGNTPLLLACFNGKTEIVDFLLAAGCDANIPDREGHTPLIMACQKATDQWYFWNTEYMNDVDNEVEVSTPTFPGSVSPAGDNNAKDPYTPDKNFPPVVICRSLLNSGQVSPTQATLLPTAVLYGTRETVREFLELGMSVNMLDENGRSPLGCSCKSSHVPSTMVKLLLEHGADVKENAGGRKERPIILAYVFNSVTKIRILLSYGATVRPEELSELMSISITKWFLENPDIINQESKDLLALKLLLKAGFRPVHSVISNKLKRVAMCSSYTTIRPWIYDLLFPLPSLADICRVKIRAQLKPCIDDNVAFLPLPNTLKSFLRFDEFNTLPWTG